MRYNLGLKRLAAILSLAVASAAQATTIDVVKITNAGNAADSTGFGAVNHNFRMGTYEVTAGQYAEFLNAAARSDLLGLYNPKMWTDVRGCKIQRTGYFGTYVYQVDSNYANRPVNFVSFWDATRFANWMHNGAEDRGDTETGAYINIGDQATFARTDDARAFIPTDDEWYKAAYHQNDGVTGNYYAYTTSSDNAPSNTLSLGDNNATFYINNQYTEGPPHYRTEVGAHANSMSPYGTFDQGGNVREWTETTVGSLLVVRGGAYVLPVGQLNASTFTSADPTEETSTLGFRLAAIPEPSTLAMLAGLSLVGLVWWRRRK